MRGRAWAYKPRVAWRALLLLALAPAKSFYGPGRPFAIGDEPRELQRRLVRRAIADIRATLTIARPPFADSANVEPLLDRLAAGQAAVQGGVKVSPGPNGWSFGAAPPRRSL